MKYYQAVLYDIDGTLLDTRDMNLYPLLRIIKEELGQDWTYDQVKKYLAYTGMQVMEELNIRDKETTYARWVRYVNEYPEPAKLFPGLAEALAEIHQEGFCRPLCPPKSTPSLKSTWRAKESFLTLPQQCWRRIHSCTNPIRNRCCCV